MAGPLVFYMAIHSWLLIALVFPDFPVYLKHAALNAGPSGSSASKNFRSLTVGAFRQRSYRETLSSATRPSRQKACGTAVAEIIYDNGESLFSVARHMPRSVAKQARGMVGNLRFYPVVQLQESAAHLLPRKPLALFQHILPKTVQRARFLHPHHPFG